MKRMFKALAVIVLALVVLLGIAAAGLYGISSRHFSRSYKIEISPVSVPSDSGSIAYGKRFASVIAKCTDCHGANLQGQVMVDNAAFGTLAAANLTSGKGGVAKSYQSDADWVRSIRHAVNPAGRPLFFMPSALYNGMTDEDLGRLIAYLKSLPPVDNTLPASKIGPVARALYLSGKLPLLNAEMIDHKARSVAAITPGATVEYGKYLSVVGGCAGCHRATFEGGVDPAAPPGSAIPANLTRGGDLGKWSEADFFRALREGKRPDGRVLDSFMPWRYTAQMTDDEIRALWLYLQTVPPRETPKS